jgi:hypothetical protein
MLSSLTKGDFMIFRIALILIIINSAACGHMGQQRHEEQNHSEIISTYLMEHKAPYQSTLEEHQAYLATYERYLNSVAQLFEQRGASDHFEDYLNTLKVNSHEREKLLEEIPERFTKETGTPADPRSREYQLYTTKVMTTFHDELNKARVQKLRGQLGKDTFNELVRNNKEFNQINGREKPQFLFPL